LLLTVVCNAAGCKSAAEARVELDNAALMDQFHDDEPPIKWTNIAANSVDRMRTRELTGA